MASTGDQDNQHSLDGQYRRPFKTTNTPLMASTGHQDNQHSLDGQVRILKKAGT
ncbi:hypothetical protein PTTG_28430 [Puccinia triticina 1-1 BBBD Race 1]|uniref:Uncharacterized protein n=1 Tax=Puccinia triticina (isolate 1-1 / race 1 (BBBD)) TaxID=630390 RepID=A0A180GC19_PUCT1|nr:hypothetical protein PTTG_28430 [Puccinia triticina 1-1 BBBD Race 1]